MNTEHTEWDGAGFEEEVGPTRWYGPQGSRVDVPAFSISLSWTTRWWKPSFNLQFWHRHFTAGWFVTEDE